MDSYPCLEIDPVRTLMVLGPQVTAECLGDCSTHHLSYRLLVESGIKTVLEMESFPTKEDRARKETLLRHAYELEPPFASSKIVEVLRAHGHYENWLEQTFSTANVKLTEQGNAVLQHLRALRQEGVRLAYTHYDETLSRALGLQPVIMEDTDGVKKWSQGFPALLHLHGVAAHPQSVMFDCLSYENAVGGAPSAELILEQFRAKTVIFVGFDDIYFDPFLHKLVKMFASSQEAKLACPPLFLSSTMTTHPNGVLPLPVRPIADLHSYIRSSSTNFKTASSQAPILFQFVFTSQAASQGFLDKLQKTVDSASSLSPLAGTVGSHFVVLLQVQGPATMLKVWEAMFKDTVKMSDLSGLLAAALQDRFTVWLKQGDSDTPSSGTIQNGVSLPPVLIPNSSSSANGFIPVPVPVTSWKPFSAISFSPQFALACNTQKQLELAQQQLQAIRNEKLRRIQSENDKLSFQDQVENTRKSPSRNGFLVHQQSAPTIPISPAVMLSAADVQTSLSSPIAVPSPSILMNLDQKLKEHRIECIEQQPRIAKKQWKEEMSSTPTRIEGDDKGMDKDQKEASPPFEEQRQKYIEEARKFSATVGTWIQQQEQDTQGAVTLPASSDSFQEVGRHFEQLQRITLGAAATGMPLVPLGVPGGLMSLPLHSPSTTSSSILSPSTPSASSHSPKVLPSLQQPQQQQSPALVPLLGSNPHSAASMVTLLQPNLPLTSLAGTVFSPQLPVFMTPPASCKSSTSSDPPSVPAALPISTAINDHQPFGIEQKVMVLMPNGSVVSMAMPSAMARVPGSPAVVKQEEDKGEVFVRHAPKRTGSPNSDTIYHSKPPLKRRRSSSLPDVSLGSTAKTPSTLSPTSPIPSSPSHTISNGILTAEGGPSLVQFPPSLLLSRIPSTIIQDQEKNECSSLESSSLHPVPPGRGPIQLWQFLLDLLMTQDKAHMIQWTGNGYEFRIIQPEEIAKLWGARKNKPRMNYDKLSRGLRYYYSKGIMDKVPGKKLTFKYTCDIQQYMMQKSGNTNSHPAHSKTIPTVAV